MTRVASRELSSQILVVVCGGVWWFAVVCGGLRWFVVDCGGLSFGHTPAQLLLADSVRWISTPPRSVFLFYFQVPQVGLGLGLVGG